MTVRDYLKIKHDVDGSEILTELNQLNNSFEFDTYFTVSKCIERLKDDYKQRGDIIIAYDFDDTVMPSKPNYMCTSVVKLLQLCSKLPFSMLCYTARCTQTDIESVKNDLDDLGIRYDAINDDVYRIKKEVNFECAHKIWYSIFLDDRAGLQSAYKALSGFVTWFLDNELEDVR